MDFKRMWMNLKEKVEKEGEERDFYFIDFIDTLLSNMEASEQFEVDLLELIDDIEYSQLKMLFDKEDIEQEATE